MGQGEREFRWGVAGVGGGDWGWLRRVSLNNVGVSEKQKNILLLHLAKFSNFFSQPLGNLITSLFNVISKAFQAHLCSPFLHKQLIICIK